MNSHYSLQLTGKFRLQTPVFLHLSALDFVHVSYTQGQTDSRIIPWVFKPYRCLECTPGLCTALVEEAGKCSINHVDPLSLPITREKQSPNLRTVMIYHRCLVNYCAQHYHYIYILFRSLQTPRIREGYCCRTQGNVLKGLY